MVFFFLVSICSGSLSQQKLGDDLLLWWNWSFSEIIQMRYQDWCVSYVCICVIALVRERFVFFCEKKIHIEKQIPNKTCDKWQQCQQKSGFLFNLNPAVWGTRRTQRYTFSHKSQVLHFILLFFFSWLCQSICPHRLYVIVSFSV